MFHLSIILLSVVTACLPLFVKAAAEWFPKWEPLKAPVWLPVSAGALMVISVLLPDVHISSQTTTFQQHFVGGGMYSACLYLYAKRLFGWRFHWLVDLVMLFAWVSALGVANKLGEFALLELGLLNLDTADAYWDLLANTLGGFAGYLLFYKLANLSREK